MKLNKVFSLLYFCVNLLFAITVSFVSTVLFVSTVQLVSFVSTVSNNFYTYLRLLWENKTFGISLVLKLYDTLVLISALTITNLSN